MRRATGPVVVDLRFDDAYNDDMKRRGLTLVEVVLVIAMVGLLAGLSLPILRSSRERARTVVCAGKVKQLLGGLFCYQTDTGVFPYGFQLSTSGLRTPGHYAGIAGAVDLAGRWWFDSFETIDHATGSGEELLTCPSKRQAGSLLSLNLLCGNYAANLSIFRVRQYTEPYGCNFSGDCLRPGEISRPGETLLLVDGGYSLISWWHATSEPPVQLPPPALSPGGIQHGAYVPGMGINAERILLPGQTDDAIGGRHPGRTVNMGFADGGVARRQADTLLVEKSQESWDNSPLWRPGGDTVTE
jgi:prepilin-type processing-associated H-X9-DG protein/prepilin-type N-terminal cleavage/methylation domain-containing protein